MLMSLLLFSAHILIVIADAFIPSVLLYALSLQTLLHFDNYDFRDSLIDIPLVSIIRSLIIFCVYSFCDGPRLSRGPYLGITTLCSVLSIMFVSLKGVYVFRKWGVDGREGFQLARMVMQESTMEEEDPSHHRQTQPNYNPQNSSTAVSTTTTTGYSEGEVVDGDPEVWAAFNKNFDQVQSVLDRNRVLIQQVNENQESRVPDNMAKNVNLIQELNCNMSKVVSLYSHLNSNFSNACQQHSNNNNNSSN
ncbi:hypothetical protein TanjilG_00661 [Lupinus angustifolius]|uniref:Protein EARLY FLOWERING 4 domain-containing protein n=1 Tax=Lupinus angustifolius TaxID=3871 RepID=A0A4P1R7L7_LUPAN|nr:hypothetical protein TanjilG_00661 [Lupinus angustifolius]